MDGKQQKASAPSGEAPLCICGCGQKTNWNPRQKRWGRYIFGHSRTAKETRYKAWQKTMRPVKDNQLPPPCLCGCGTQVKVHSHGAGRYWGNYVKGHQMIGRRGIHSKQSLEARSKRMRDHNPMFDPEIAKKAHRTRGIVESPTKVEKRFSGFCKKHKLPISFRGTGKLWINRRNPDFRVVKQKKVIEITTNGIFNGGHVEPRDIDSYGIPLCEHYNASGWWCLVVFCPSDHRRRLPIALLPILKDFCSQKSQWNGVWNYERLILLEN